MNSLAASALYQGEVMHRRFSPRAHAFRYPVSLLYLDLAEQAQLFALSPWCSPSRWAALSFREQDYLPDLTQHGQSLSAAVRQRVLTILGHAPQGAIRVLTQPRSFGWSFNPLSVFYLFDEQAQLAAILLEVSNTPWHERAYYALDCQGDGHQGGSVGKAMHVSPFLPREMTYKMRFSQPASRLGLHIANHPQQADGSLAAKTFDATLNLTHRPLNRSTLHQHLRQHPWLTAQTVARIHWQALQLLVKRTPITDHQALTELPTHALHREL
ncbi:DUF1365 domain-containing protein [Atopomonas sediminilitoris]|uniref:DUF1365 domain-containing protein n=1 Tax=Atopomonas sediminilitoris TaxID=2919919 RepID=UPI001F4D6E50|nr:DUF1365 domain-containing protein [Atopomonas sediminilitoris]MCJ8168094.1 DUF1365 domain-containing protein [Atopomonas sediminilitoris]